MVDGAGFGNFGVGGCSRFRVRFAVLSFCCSALCTVWRRPFLPLVSST